MGQAVAEWESEGSEDSASSWLGRRCPVLAMCAALSTSVFLSFS
jgi:hypothetical protein